MSLSRPGLRATPLPEELLGRSAPTVPQWFRPQENPLFVILDRQAELPAEDQRARTSGDSAALSTGVVKTTASTGERIHWVTNPTANLGLHIDAQQPAVDIDAAPFRPQPQFSEPQFSQRHGKQPHRIRRGVSSADLYRSSPPKAANRVSLGETVTACLLIAPNVLNWMVLLEATYVSTTTFVDSEGTAHEISRSRNKNFQWCYYCFLIASITSVIAHTWLKLTRVANRHWLKRSGAIRNDEGDLQGYEVRLKSAEKESRRLTLSEWLHTALVGMDFFYSSFFAFSGAQQASWGEMFYGLVPTTFLIILLSQVVTRARSAVLHKQRTASVAFAGSALHGSLLVLTVQVLVLARLVAFSLDYPTDLFFTDCPFETNMDPATNLTWEVAAPISTCSPALFLDGKVPKIDSMVLRGYHPLDAQINGSLVVIYYLSFGTVLYYSARGQGLLHDRLFAHLEMGWKHVFALLCWLVATFGLLIALGTMSAEWGHRGHSAQARWRMHYCTLFGMLGLVAVLWMDSAISVVRNAVKYEKDPHVVEATHTVFASMRFIDGQPLNEAIQLRETLKHHYNIHLKIVELLAGADITEEVFESIEECDVFLAFGTQDYGAKTANPACTYHEVEYARSANKRILLLRMSKCILATGFPLMFTQLKAVIQTRLKRAKLDRRGFAVCFARRCTACLVHPLVKMIQNCTLCTG